MLGEEGRIGVVEVPLEGMQAARSRQRKGSKRRFMVLSIDEARSD